MLAKAVLRIFWNLHQPWAEEGPGAATQTCHTRSVLGQHPGWLPQKKNEGPLTGKHKYFLSQPGSDGDICC